MRPKLICRVDHAKCEKLCHIHMKGVGLADKMWFGEVQRGRLPVDADLDGHCAVEGTASVE